MEILSELNQVIKGSVLVEGGLFYRGTRIVYVKSAGLVVNIDPDTSLLDAIVPILNTKPAIKQLTMWTERGDTVTYDRTVMRRLVYESGIECLSRVYFEWYLGDTSTCKFLRSEIVPEWCAQYIPLLQEKLPLELIRLVIKTLFYSSDI